MPFIGRRGWINITLEDTPGEPKPPSDIYLPFLECTLVEKMTPIADLSARGVRDEQGESSQIGKMWGEGRIRVNLDPVYAPVLLGLALGNFNVSPVGGGVYLHTFTRRNSNVPKTASVIFDRVVDRLLFTNLVVNTLELSFSDGLVEVTAECLSKYPTLTTSGNLAVPSNMTLFTFADATVQMGEDLEDAEESDPVQVREFSLTINNNAETLFFIGSNEVNSIVVKNFGVAGRISMLFEDTTNKNIFVNLRKVAMIVTLRGRDLGPDMYEFVKFKLPKVRFESWAPDLSIDDIAKEGIDFIAEFSREAGKTIEIQVRNERSAY